MKVVVLGAGVVGVATAWHLVKLGHAVTVIERREAAALETSWGNGGVIHASEVEPWSQPGMPRKIVRWLGQESAPLLLRYRAIPQMWRWGLSFARNCRPERFRANTLANLKLALLSLRTLQEIRAETGIQYDLGTRGVLKIYANAASLAAATRACEALSAHGLTFEPVDVPRLVALEPALAATAPTLAGGLYFPRDEVGDCNKFTQGLAADAAAKGATFHYQTNVTGLEVTEGRARGVLTDRGRHAADAIVVALGSFTPLLLRAVGLPVPIYPVKGLSITVQAAGWAGAPRMPIIDDSRLFGLVPIGDRLRVSGSAEITGYDATPAPARSAAIIANVKSVFPDFEKCFDPATARFWAGLRPVTPSGTPYLGATRIPGLFVNAGHGHLGWTLACGSGRVVADVVAGRQPPIALPQLRVAA